MSMRVWESECIAAVKTTRSQKECKVVRKKMKVQETRREKESKGMGKGVGMRKNVPMSRKRKCTRKSQHE